MTKHTKNQTLHTWGLTAALLGALALSAPAQAVVTGYTDATSFMAAVQAAGTDSFDDLPPFTLLVTPAERSTSPVVYSYRADASTGLFGLNEGGDGLLSTNDFFDTLVFSNFSAGVSAAGLNAFGTDFDGLAIGGVTINVRAVDTLGDVLTLSLSEAGPTSFFGFTSNAQIDSLVVEITSQTNSYATANNLVLASAVPEPGSTALMLGGLGLMGWLARRRRAA